jgi:hypothetical protein
MINMSILKRAIISSILMKVLIDPYKVIGKERQIKYRDPLIEFL